MHLFRSFFLVLLCLSIQNQLSAQPNVVLIITDDQGFGDFGAHGNPHIKTPVLDKLSTESVAFRNFYVSPVCAPTRASLMTGRYCLRTGVRDTYNGGAMMSTDEVTIAEALKSSGYRTGIFGKWHLGDNYPSRPMDQGFDESVIHLAGGMGQVGDFTTYFKGDSSYFDPVLWHNGQQQQYEGYCSDIFADQALRFIEEHRDEPFFCYLAFNAPHTPLQVPDEYYQRYKDVDPSTGFTYDHRPFPEMSEKDKEDARKVYAMVTNIDDNVGRVLNLLDELDLDQETIVIFMTDNGPQQRRYVDGMRGRKGSVYRGGVRVPFYLRYPARFAAGSQIDVNAAHIDILPTLIDLCGVAPSSEVALDGRSLVSLLNGDDITWDDRSLFFYWTRGYPERYHNIAIQKGTYKLVGQTRYDQPITSFELFDVHQDPYELDNLVVKKEQVALQLRDTLDRYYYELIQSPRLLDAPRIYIGSAQENPVVLNRNDASGSRGIWDQENIYGKWRVHIVEGRYDVEFRFLNNLHPPGALYLEAETTVYRIPVEDAGFNTFHMDDIYLPEMDTEVVPFYQASGERIFPFWVQFNRRDL